MDRKPKAAPFSVGARLRYVGTLRMSTVDGRPICEPGLVAVVVDTRPGRQGTGRMIDLDDGDEPVRDTTRDGYSVVEPVPGWRRIASLGEWMLAVD